MAIYDSKTENKPIGAGEQQEFTVEFGKGGHSVLVIEVDCESRLSVELFLETGQRVASDEGNMPGNCFIILSRAAPITVRITRPYLQVGGDATEKIHYIVTRHDQDFSAHRL